jgi:hypothetical protein
MTELFKPGSALLGWPGLFYFVLPSQYTMTLFRSCLNSIILCITNFAI